MCLCKSWEARAERHESPVQLFFREHPVCERPSLLLPSLALSFSLSLSLSLLYVMAYVLHYVLDTFVHGQLDIRTEGGRGRSCRWLHVHARAPTHVHARARAHVHVHETTLTTYISASVRCTHTPRHIYIHVHTYAYVHLHTSIGALVRVPCVPQWRSTVTSEITSATFLKKIEIFERDVFD